jgi:hypothetical protein
MISYEASKSLSILTDILKSTLFLRMLQTTDSIPSALPMSHQTIPKNISLSVERERVKRRMDGFNWKQSMVWAHLNHLYGPKLSQDELVSIGELIAQTLQIKLDRDARRRKPVMIKWFEENWISIQPLLFHVVLDNN